MTYYLCFKHLISTAVATAAGVSAVRVVVMLMLVPAIRIRGPCTGRGMEIVSTTVDFFSAASLWQGCFVTVLVVRAMMVMNAASQGCSCFHQHERDLCWLPCSHVVMVSTLSSPPNWQQWQRHAFAVVSDLSPVASTAIPALKAILRQV